VCTGQRAEEDDCSGSVYAAWKAQLVAAAAKPTAEAGGDGSGGGGGGGGSGGGASLTAYVCVPSRALSARAWLTAQAVSQLVQTDGAVRQCLVDRARMGEYMRQSKRSLVHRAFACPGVCVGAGRPDADPTWYTIEPVAEGTLLHDAAQAVRGKFATWRLLALSTKDSEELGWLFALCAASLESSADVRYEDVLAHRLMLRTWRYWGAANAWPVRAAECLRRIVARCNFIHTGIRAGHDEEHHEPKAATETEVKTETEAATKAPAEAAVKKAALQPQPSPELLSLRRAKSTDAPVDTAAPRLQLPRKRALTEGQIRNITIAGLQAYHIREAINSAAK